MKDIEDNINIFVQNHFPEFYKQEGNMFIEFVNEYYKWTQEANNNTYYARNLLEYRDIDKTVDDFLYHFKQKYLIGSPLLQENTRFNVKHSLDFYRSKGTEQGVKLYFQEIYGESDVQVYFPGRDILRASDGEWYVPVYLELSISEKTKTFVGRQITGSSSRAVAFVEGVNRKVIDGKYLDVVYLSSVQGNFILDDIITVDGDLSDCPVVVGSLTKLTVDLPGRNFSVGDVVDIVSSSRGRQGKARIDNVVDTTGRVEFTLLDGGSGYQLSTVPIVAERTLILSNVTSTNTSITGFEIDEFIYQPLANITFTSSGTDFTIGSPIVGANSSSNVATGFVMGRNTKTITGTATASNTSNVVVGTNTSFITELANNDYVRFQACTTSYQISSVTNATHLVLTANGPSVVGNTMTMANGSLLVSVSTGDFSAADRIANSTALISLYQNRTASGKVMGVNSTAVGVINVSNVFTSNTGNFLYGATSNVHAKVLISSTGSGASFQIGSLTDEETVYLNTDLLSDNNSILTTLLTGTATTNSSTNQVTGTGTNFTTELYDGAYIKFSGNTLTFQVNTVANNTSLVLTTVGPNVTSNTLSITNGEFMTTPISALRYGFPKLINANSATLLNLALTRQDFTIGTISSLTGINPGADYNVSPLVQIRDVISKYGRKNLSVEIANVSGIFVVGEEITQDFTEDAYTLVISGSNTAFEVTETVTQQINASSNAYGEVRTSSLGTAVIATPDIFVNSSLSSVLSGTVTSNATSPQVNGTSTAFVSQLSAGDYIKFSGNNLIFQVNNVVSDTVLNLTTNSAVITSGNTLAKASNVAVGMTSGRYFFVNTAISNSQLSISRGVVLSQQPTFIEVKRKTFNQTFTPGIRIEGSVSGASADVLNVTQIDNSLEMGNNAIVNAYAGIVAGSIGSATVVDSGFAYEQGEYVTLYTPNGAYSATAYANLINQGVGEGYFKSTRGFLNSDKYIHDGNFYQSYSYQVRAGLPLDVYGDTLKQLCHVAGTKLFGNLIKTSNADVTITTTGVHIET